MNEERKKTPINTMQGYELNARLTSILQQAYHRRSRQLPANLNDIVETLKGDLLKAYPDVPVEVVDDSIVLSTLHDADTPLSPTFFFNAVKKAWFTPKTNTHQWDGRDEDLAYWQDLATRHPWDTHAAEMVEHYRHGDTEQDAIDLLDTCADMLRRMDADTADDPRKPLKGSICLPAFNARREFEYLKLRGQVTPQTAASKLTQALEAVNAERIASQHPRIRKEDALKDPDVVAQCRRLAVIDWLRACNISETTPRAVLMPLQDAATYNELRAKY